MKILGKVFIFLTVITLVLVSVAGCGGPTAPTVNAYLLEQAIDGTLYTVVVNGTTHQLSKSTDGGDTFSATGVPSLSPIVAIATSPSDPAVVHFATATIVYKSNDGGTTFFALPTIPVNHSITALDAGQVPTGDYVVVGTTAPANTADVFLLYQRRLAVDIPVFQSDPTLLTEGPPASSWRNLHFNADMVAAYTLGSGLDRIVAVAIAPDFATSYAVVAVGNDSTGSATIISVSSGSVWGAAIGNPAAPITGTATLGDIAFADDYDTTTNPTFFFGINDTDVVNDASGVYKFQGVAAPGNSVVTLTSAAAQVVTVDVAGPVGVAYVLAGLTNDTVIRSMNGGATWLPASVQPAGSDNTYVVLANNPTTSGTTEAWSLVSGTAGGLSLSMDSGDIWDLIWEPQPKE